MSTLSLWTRRDPFAEFDAVVRRAFAPVGRPAGFTPAAELTRDGDDAVLRLELPGVDVAKDVVVEVDSGRLVVRGERRDERSEKNDGYQLREVRYGSFRRTFGLPAHVSADDVSATYDAGVLSVRVAGVHAGTDAQRIAVQVPAVEAAADDSEQPAA